MPKYYCDYCKSYLTHDTMSVRKSHLMGRNHIKYYCEYYEQKAKQTGIWTPLDLPYEITLEYLNRGAPGSKSIISGNNNYNTTKKGEPEPTQYEIQSSFALPPPPSLPNLPNPPPSVLRNTKEYRKAIEVHKQKDAY